MRIISYPISNEDLDLGDLLLKLEEECDEFLSAIEFADDDNALEEFYDVIQVMVNILDKVGITTKEIESAYFKHHRKLLNRGWEFKK